MSLMPMLERFTQRSRRVLTFAHHEAERLQQTKVSPEHILLGFFQDEAGVGSRVLSELGITYTDLKNHIEESSTPEKMFDSKKVELSIEVKQLLNYAVDEAQRVGHNFVGTEHLLIGLVKFENKATDALKRFNITSEQVRQQSRRILDTSDALTYLSDALKIKFSRALKVFLCHSSADKSYVRRLFSRLKSTEVIDPWLDEEKLLPGQKWQVEIPKAVRNSDVILVCLSKNSIDKIGYVQKEIKIALDVADEHPDNSIFIIPARLEECIVPERLQQWHWVDLFEQKGEDKLFRAFEERANRLGIVLK